MNDLLTILNPHFILHNAFYGCLAVGLFCPLIGVFFYLRRAVLLGVALPQVSAAGVAFAFFLQSLGFHWSLHADETNDRFLALAGSVLFTLLTILILSIIERRGRGTTDSRLGAVYALAFSLSILFVSENPIGQTEFLGMLSGEIVSVTADDLAILILSYSALALLLFVLHKQLLLVSFDRETALVMGKNVILWESLLYTLMGLSISIGVLMGGPMLAFAFLIIPPLAARRFVRRMPSFFAVASLIGGISAFIGFYVSYHWDLPLSPSAIAVSALFLGLSSLTSTSR